MSHWHDVRVRGSLPATPGIRDQGKAHDPLTVQPAWL